MLLLLNRGYFPSKSEALAVEVNIDKACVCSSKEKGHAMTARKTQHCVYVCICFCMKSCCIRIFVIYVLMYEHMLVYMNMHIWIHMPVTLYLWVCVRMCEWNILNVRVFKMSCRLQYLKSSILVVHQWPGLRWGHSLASSSSSQLYASAVQHLQGPGLNLFFLIAHNCSVDVYFLISSNITGSW